jgi:hypothetical protein
MIKRILALAAATAALAAPAVASAQEIQPGESITMGGSFCTLNWIYDGPDGDVYAGTAAHCVAGVGQEVSLATGSLGQPIERIGEVAFVGDESQPGRDYAFIEIDPEQLDKVSPAMKGHPSIPTGLSTDYQNGDLMQFSGNGVGFHATGITREQRAGVLNWTDGIEHQIVGAVSFGDSGGPVGNLTDGNTAFGIATTLGAGVNSDAMTVVTAGEGGENLDFVLDDAASHGFPVELRTVD